MTWFLIGLGVIAGVFILLAWFASACYAFLGYNEFNDYYPYWDERPEDERPETDVGEES